MITDLSMLHDLSDEEIVSGYKLITSESAPKSSFERGVIDLLKQMQKPAFRPVYVEWTNGLHVFIALDLERGVSSPTPSQLYSHFQMALASLIVTESMAEEERQ